MLQDPFTLIAILFFVVSALLIVLWLVFKKVCELEEKTMHLTRDAQARFWSLEEDLSRIRQKEAVRRIRDKRWSERSKELRFVDLSGQEVPVKRSS